MKVIAKLLIPLVLTMLVASACDDDKVVDNEGGADAPVILPDTTPEYLFALQNASVADEALVIEEGDSVGIFILKPDTLLVLAPEAFIAESETKIAFEIDSAEGITSGDAVLAYVPYSKATASQDPSEVYFSLPALQSQAGSVYSDAGLPRVSVPFEADRTLPTGRKVLAGELSMIPLFALAEFVVTSPLASYAGQRIESLTWTADGLSGDFKYDLTSQETLLPALSGNSVRTSVSGLVMPGYGELVKVYMAVAPGMHGGQLTFRTESAEIDFALQPQQFLQGVMTTVEVELESGTVAGPESFRDPDRFEW